MDCIYFKQPTDDWCDGRFGVSEIGNYYVQACESHSLAEGVALHLWAQVDLADWIKLRDGLSDEVVVGRLITPALGLRLWEEVEIDPSKGESEDSVGLMAPLRPVTPEQIALIVDAT